MINCPPVHSSSPFCAQCVGLCISHLVRVYQFSLSSILRLCWESHVHFFAVFFLPFSIRPASPILGYSFGTSNSINGHQFIINTTRPGLLIFFGVIVFTCPCFFSFARVLICLSSSLSVRSLWSVASVFWPPFWLTSAASLAATGANKSKASSADANSKHSWCSGLMNRTRQTRPYRVQFV